MNTSLKSTLMHFTNHRSAFGSISDTFNMHTSIQHLQITYVIWPPLYCCDFLLAHLSHSHLLTVKALPMHTVNLLLSNSNSLEYIPSLVHTCSLSLSLYHSSRTTERRTQVFKSIKSQSLTVTQLSSQFIQFRGSNTCSAFGYPQHPVPSSAQL